MSRALTDPVDAIALEAMLSEIIEGILEDTTPENTSSILDELFVMHHRFDQLADDYVRLMTATTDLDPEIAEFDFDAARDELRNLLEDLSNEVIDADEVVDEIHLTRRRAFRAYTLPDWRPDIELGP